MSVKDDEAASRRDYARSIQQRNADTISAGIAEAWRAGGEKVSEHLDAVRQRLADAGVELDIVGEAQQREAALKQLHELDEPGIRALIEGQVAWLQKGARRLGLTGLDSITASSLPGGSINAMCANDPGDGSHHVFADGELLVFCNALGKLVATAFTKAPDTASAPFVLKVPIHGSTRAFFDAELSKRVVDLFVAVLFTGRSRVSEPWLPEDRSILVAAGLAWGMEAFVIAHELGHVAAGHLSGDTLSASDPSEDTAAIRQAQEFEADGLAFELTLAASWGTPLLVFQLLGPYVFLKGIELLQEGHAFFGGDEKIFESHPGTSERLIRIRQAIPTALSDLELKMLSVTTLARIDAVFLAWRGQLMSFLDAAKAQGHTPRDGRIPYRATFVRPAILGD